MVPIKLDIELKKLNEGSKLCKGTVYRQILPNLPHDKLYRAFKWIKPSRDENQNKIPKSKREYEKALSVDYAELLGNDFNNVILKPPKEEAEYGIRELKIKKIENIVIEDINGDLININLKVFYKPNSEDKSIYIKRGYEKDPHSEIELINKKMTDKLNDCISVVLAKISVKCK